MAVPKVEPAAPSRQFLVSSSLPNDDTEHLFRTITQSKDVTLPYLVFVHSSPEPQDDAQHDQPPQDEQGDALQ